MYLLLAFIPTLVLCECVIGKNQTKLKEAREYLSYLDKKVCQGKFEQITAEFNYFTNSTKENLNKMAEQDGRPKLFDAEYKSFDWKSFNDPNLLRQAKLYTVLEKPIDPVLLKAYGEIISQLVDSPGYDELCFYHNRSVCGEPVDYVVEKIFKTSRDAKELEYYWIGSHNQSTRGPRPLYKQYVDISNKVAIANKFANHADELMDSFEAPPVPEFQSAMVGLYKQLEPLYLQYFSFVRSRFRKVFGEDVVPRKGPIPVYLLGSFSGTFISSQLEDLKPYPGKPSIDVTEQLKKQNFTVLNIVELVEDFYKSLGFEPLPDTFWKNSMFVAPDDREVSCVSISWDFYNQKDYRISTCGGVNMYNVFMFVHEFGHLHYFVGYKDQPCCFRNAPSSGLDEGVADTMGLSFTSYPHLARLGLIEDPCNDDPEVEINSLFVQGQEKISILPLTIFLDLWRWDCLRGNISSDNYNAAWWEYRLEYQGVVPPGKRSEEYLDAGERIQVLDDTPYISYLLSRIYAFQFHEALCIAAGQFDPKNPKNNPLHKCDIYGSKKAGKLFKKLHVLGSSKPWPAAVKAVTGQPNLDAGPLLRYFAPLYDWLVEENKKTGEYIGWK